MFYDSCSANLIIKPHFIVYERVYQTWLYFIVTENLMLFYINLKFRQLERNHHIIKLFYDQRPKRNKHSLTKSLSISKIFSHKNFIKKKTITAMESSMCKPRYIAAFFFSILSDVLIYCPVWHAHRKQEFWILRTCVDDSESMLSTRLKSTPISVIFSMRNHITIIFCM